MEAQKKSPDPLGQGFESLNAVITVRRLLREEKQGMTTLRLSFTANFSRWNEHFYRFETRRNARNLSDLGSRPIQSTTGS